MCQVLVYRNVTCMPLELLGKKWCWSWTSFFLAVLSPREFRCATEAASIMVPISLQIADIRYRLSTRWLKKKEHIEWQKKGCIGEEPTYMDLDTREVRSAK